MSGKCSTYPARHEQEVRPHGVTVGSCGGVVCAVTMTSGNFATALWFHCLRTHVGTMSNICSSYEESIYICPWVRCSLTGWVRSFQYTTEIFTHIYCALFCCIISLLMFFTVTSLTLIQWSKHEEIWKTWHVLTRHDKTQQSIPDNKVHGANMGPIWGR